MTRHPQPPRNSAPRASERGHSNWPTKACLLLCLATLTTTTAGCNYFEPRGRNTRPPDPTEPVRIQTPPDPRSREELDSEEEHGAAADKKADGIIYDEDGRPLRRGEYAARINRTLIYPVQWLRAEDLSDTLLALLEARYGPGIRIIPHAESNHLLIYLPPFADWQGGGPAGRPPGSDRSRTSTRSTSTSRGTGARR